MADFDYIAVFISIADSEEAELISHVLVENKQAACVNIISGVHAIFWWKKHIDEEEESLLMVKTKASMLDGVVNTVREIHSYENPEIIAIPIIGGSQDYLDWIDKVVES